MSALTPGAVSSARTGNRTVIAVAACWALAALTVAGTFTVAPSAPGQRLVLAIVVAVALVPLILGAVIAQHAPGNTAGPLVASAGLALIVTNAPGDLAPAALAGDWMLLYLPFAILLLTVPDGRARSARWRAAGWAITAATVAFIALCALEALAPGARAILVPASLAALAAFAVLLIVCALAPVARYRSEDERARARLRWVFLAGLSLPAALLLCWTSYLLTGGADLVAFGLVLMYVTIPTGVTVALVQPELFDIDRAAVAATTAGALATVVLCTLSAASGLAGLALADWSPVAAIGVTAALTLSAGAAFPWVHRGLDRALYPERGRAMVALRDLAARVDAGAAVPEDVQTVLRTALRDPGLVVALRHPAGTTLVDLSDRSIAPSDVAVPVRLRGETIGAVICSPARVKRPATDIARCAAPLIDAARSRATLARANAEVEASRRRLMQASYQQRRQLERDLHDGALQRLVALGMRLRVLQRQVGTDAGAEAEFDAAVAEVVSAVAELRSLARGMRPSALDDGLAAALSELVGRAGGDGIELAVHVEEVPDLVALTAYYVVSESVANALRHAAASHIRIDVQTQAGALRVSVHDDGRGGAQPSPTGGLTGLSDRVAALGGRLDVDSPAGGGTRIEAVLPCGS